MTAHSSLRESMDAKEFARFFGGFSTEKRVKLIRTLMEAGRPGLSLIDLSRKTDLSVIVFDNFFRHQKSTSAKGVIRLIENFADQVEIQEQHLVLAFYLDIDQSHQK